MLRGITLRNVAGTSRIQIYPFDVKNLEGDKILIARNAFRPDNNVGNCLCR